MVSHVDPDEILVLIRKRFDIEIQVVFAERRIQLRFPQGEQPLLSFILRACLIITVDFHKIVFSLCNSCSFRTLIDAILNLVTHFASSISIVCYLNKCDMPGRNGFSLKKNLAGHRLDFSSSSARGKQQTEEASPPTGNAGLRVVIFRTIETHSVELHS